jgi:hypothetical protein
MLVTEMPNAGKWVAQAKKQLGTLKQTEAQKGKLKWVPMSTPTAVSDPSKLQSDFGRWMLAGGAEPDPATGSVNCWEMVLFSAYRAGHTSKARLKGIYDEAVKQIKSGARKLMGETVEIELRGSKENILDVGNPDSPEPLPGDLIIFTNAANHVAISLGSKDGTGRHNIISHWPPPDGAYTTKQTTIEELLAVMGSPQTVKFWSPSW